MAHLFDNKPDMRLLRLLVSGISGVLGKGVSGFNLGVPSKSAKATTVCLGACPKIDRSTAKACFLLIFVKGNNHSPQIVEKMN